MTLVNAQLDVTKYRTAIHPLHDYSYKNLSNSLLLWYDNQRNEIAVISHLSPQTNFFCLQLHATEAKGSIQWGMAPYPRLCVKTAGNCNNSYS